jgi:hypothetical protein
VCVQYLSCESSDGVDLALVRYHSQVRPPGGHAGQVRPLVLHRIKLLHGVVACHPVMPAQSKNLILS